MTDERFTVIMESLNAIHEYQVGIKKQVDEIEIKLDKLIGGNENHEHKPVPDISNFPDRDAKFIMGIQEEVERMKKRNDL